MLNKKLNRLEELQRRKNSIVKRYFSEELLQAIHEWKNRRNELTHAMMKNNLTTEQLRTLAEDGLQIVKTLSSRAMSYKRYLETEMAIENSNDSYDGYVTLATAEDMANF